MFTTHLLRGLCLALCLTLGGLTAADSKPRLIVETDLGGDKDDQGSLVRLLMYSNEFDLEGIICDRSDAAFGQDGLAWNPTGAANALEMANDYIDAYGQVRANLLLHQAGWPTVTYLKSITKRGHNSTQDGVNLLIAAGDKADNRVIWYGNWGSNSGTTSNLKRAFDQVKATRSASAYQTFVRKFRISTLDGSSGTKQGHNDQVLLHIETGYPTDGEGRRWYHRFQTLVGAAASDVSSGHGALGALWSGAKEGDTWTFLHLIPVGLADPEQPWTGGWAGRYGVRSGFSGRHYWASQSDSWNGSTHRDQTVNRWNGAARRDFAARMDWCVKSFAQANHEPRVVLNGVSGRAILAQNATAGQTIALSAASSSDPDAGQSLAYAWSHYREAGTYNGAVGISNASSQQATFTVPSNAAVGSTIHVILAVSDNGSPSLTRYRRLVVTVAGSTPVNQPPTVNAGSDQSHSVASGSSSTFTLNGTANDPDGSIASWQWRLGSTVVGSSASLTQTRGVGTWTYTLTVTDNHGASATDTVVVTISGTSTGGSVISGLSSTFQRTTLAVGSLLFTDRTYTITSVPTTHLGAEQIRTPNGGKSSTLASGYLVFQVTTAATVHVAYDQRAVNLPPWLSGFTATGETIGTNDTGFRLYRRSYAAGASVNLGGNLAGGASGAGSNYWVIVRGDGGTTPPPPPAIDLAINFQPASSPVVSGHLVDSGAVFASRNGQQYGWNVTNNEARDRNVTGDQRYDTCNHMQKQSGLRWELALPAGTYEVRIVRGDAAYTDQVNHLLVEGVTMRDPDGQDLHDDDTVTVTVSDGRLTIIPASDAVNAKLCFIEVISVPAGNG